MISLCSAQIQGSWCWRQPSNTWHHGASFMILRKDDILFLKSTVFSFSVIYQKALCLIWPFSQKDCSLSTCILANSSMAMFYLSFRIVSSWMFKHYGHIQSDDDRWCNLILLYFDLGNTDLFWSFPWFFFHHSSYPSI